MLKKLRCPVCNQVVMEVGEEVCVTCRQSLLAEWQQVTGGEVELEEQEVIRLLLSFFVPD